MRLIRHWYANCRRRNCWRTAVVLSHIGRCAERGVLESYEKEVGRLQVPVCRLQPLNPLSEAQRKAYGEIHDIFREKEVCLLHGVTSSGKTEVYVWLIDEVLKMGRQVLYMLPEIAITTQITERLAKLFGDKLLVYHSKFSDNERGGSLEPFAAYGRADASVRRSFLFVFAIQGSRSDYYRRGA